MRKLERGEKRVENHKRCDTVLALSIILSLFPCQTPDYTDNAVIDYRSAVSWNALPNDVKDSGLLSAFKINLMCYNIIRTL